MALGFVAVASAGERTAPARVWREGVEYTRLAVPAPRVTSGNTVEVVQVFWYSCSGCDFFEPNLLRWLARKDARATFVRIPATWTAAHRADARLFYALQVLHRGDLHQAVYDSIHRQHRLLTAPRDEDTELLQVQFAKAHGISAQDFKRALASAEVAQAMRRADETVRRYRVTATPSMVINGKYTTNDAQAGGREELIALVNYLIGLEHRAGAGRAAKRPTALSASAR